MPALGLLVPSWLDLAGWGGALFAGFAFMGLGRLLMAGRATPEAAMVAGWGATAAVLTVWGVVTLSSLRWPAVVLATIGILAQLVPGIRFASAEWRALARTAVLALPLVVVMISARPSQPDTWLNLLPNAAYIYDHGFFPADARPAAHSFIPGAPYNMQLAALIAGLITPGFPLNAMIAINLLLQLAAALLLARLVAGNGNEDKAPSWSASALGLLLATAFNPGFVPRYHLSSYSEPSVTVTIAFAGWFAARALDRASSGRNARLDLWALALTLCALINIKQESVMVAVGIVVAACGLAIMARAGKLAALLGLALAAAPAALLYLFWRWYVLRHFELGELKPLPIAEWHVIEIPLILWNMARQAGSRILLFLCLGAVGAVALWRLKSRELDLATRVAAMLAGIAIVYNAGLVFTYVAHFEGEMGIGAHSYFRYNTHLGLLLMVAIVSLVQRWPWAKFGWSWRRAVPAILVLAVLLDPFPFIRQLRFDLEVPNLRAWQVAHEAAAYLARDEKLLLVLPGDNGSAPPTIEGVLRYQPPRRPDLVASVVTAWSASAPGTEGAHALLSCAPPGIDGVAPGSAVLFVHRDQSWSPVAQWRYDPVPLHAHWSQVLAPTVFCLGG